METEARLEKKTSRLMSDFKVEFSEFFKSFATNYTREISRTSLTPLLREIDILKNVQSTGSGGQLK